MNTLFSFIISLYSLFVFMKPIIFNTSSVHLDYSDVFCGVSWVTTHIGAACSAALDPSPWSREE